MGKPAARINDMHVCPMVTPGVPPIPHVGGPIVGPGVPTVLIGGMPAATLGDMCICTGPPDTIILGSAGVMIGGKPAARMGDSCAHGGTIVIGCPTVLIGETSSSPVGGLAAMPTQVLSKVMKSVPPATASIVAQIISLKEAAKNGTPFCEKCTEETIKTAAAPPKTMEDVMSERKETARTFYKENNPDMTDEDISAHLSGIDFSQPVMIVTIPPGGGGKDGDELYQYQKRNAKGELYPGKYFASDKTSTPAKLGISDTYSVAEKVDGKYVKTDTIAKVEQTTVTVKPPPVKGLKSTAKKIDDTWSVKNKIIPTEGGATQIYVPKM